MALARSPSTFEASSPPNHIVPARIVESSPKSSCDLLWESIVRYRRRRAECLVHDILDRHYQSPRASSRSRVDSGTPKVFENGIKIHNLTAFKCFRDLWDLFRRDPHGRLDDAQLQLVQGRRVYSVRSSALTTTLTRSRSFPESSHTAPMIASTVDAIVVGGAVSFCTTIPGVDHGSSCRKCL